MLENEMAATLKSKMAAISGLFLRILDIATDWNLTLAR